MKAYSASIQLQRFVRRAIAGVLVALVAASVVGWSSRALAQGAEGATEKEKELLAILRGDAPAAEKALACKRLAVYGSSAAVGDLAKLLSDERLASWARIPLEAIPGAASDEALRKSLDGLSGNLLVGVINSIGVRRDAGSVAALTARLTDKDPEVASAAAVALGHIGDGAATKALRAALPEAPIKVRSAIAEGCILSAEKALAAGRDAEAIEIYDEIRKA
ncbi:MAG TPA: HEAT repeat domain-containing protein, partial [Pirellulaceae bacterium]|nr:HEAT repeat domain-containing protein [Pirellulaceae bacterium]